MTPLRVPLFRWIALGCWAMMAAVAAAGPVVNQVEPDGAKLVVSSPFTNCPAWAFMPLDFEAVTPGREPAEWRLDLSSGDYMGIRMKSTMVFEARPGGSRGTTLLPMWTGRRGYGNSGSLLVTRSGGGRKFGSIDGNNDWRTLTSTGVGKSSGPHMHLVNFTVENAPVDWRAYCGFHRVFLTEGEWSGLVPMARAAVLHWMRLGGNLVILGPKDGQSLEKPDIPQPENGARDGSLSHGSVTEGIFESPGSAASWKKSNDRAQMEDLELSQSDWVLRVMDGNTQNEWRNAVPALFEGFSGRRMSWLMVVAVVVFAVLAGPVNVFVLASSRRRHRLFFTTPLISLLAGGVLVLVVILSDGLGGKGHRFVWVESVPADNISYVVQHQHSRCGAMFSTGFEIPEPAYFAPMVDEDSEQAGSFAVTLGRDKVTATGPWFSSRRSQGFFLSAARPGRGRVELGGAAGRPVLTSAFEFPLERVFWLDRDGKTWWHAGAMAQGVATPLAASSLAEVEKALAEFTDSAPVDYHEKLVEAIERPGFFVALAGKVTAIETHRGIRWQTHGIVTGPAVTP